MIFQLLLQKVNVWKPSEYFSSNFLEVFLFFCFVLFCCLSSFLHLHCVRALFIWSKGFITECPSWHNLSQSWLMLGFYHETLFSGLQTIFYPTCDQPEMFNQPKRMCLEFYKGGTYLPWCHYPIITISIKTYIWDPLIAKWFSLQFIYYLHIRNYIKKHCHLKSGSKLRLNLQNLRLKMGQT